MMEPQQQLFQSSPCLGELINQARMLATSAVSIAWESLPDLSSTLRTGPRDSADREPTSLFKKLPPKGIIGARGTKQQKPEALFAYHELALMILEAAKQRSQRHCPPPTNSFAKQDDNIAVHRWKTSIFCDQNGSS